MPAFRNFTAIVLFHRPRPLLVLLLTAALASASCSKSAEERRKEDEALKAKVSATQRSESAAAAVTREQDTRAQAAGDKLREVQVRTESEATFAQFKNQQFAPTPADEARVLNQQVARLRARMPEPESMEVRRSSLNAARSAVCLEVNYKNLGKYVGLRRAYVTQDVIWVEPEPDEVSHRVFELNYKGFGCDAALDGK